jgi:hypothetical protein
MVVISKIFEEFKSQNDTVLDQSGLAYSARKDHAINRAVRCEPAK